MAPVATPRSGGGLARRTPLRRRRLGMCVMLLGACLAASRLADQLPLQRAFLQGAPLEATALAPQTGPAPGRRDALGAAAVTGASAVAMWPAAPEPAEAFRLDRIINAKRRWLPKIRMAYQKLEGLRDDLFITVEFPDGKKVDYAARVAAWYDGNDAKLKGPVVLAPGAGCAAYAEKVAEGSVVLVPRADCNFADKVRFAEAAGAKSVVLYDAQPSASKTRQSVKGAAPVAGGFGSGSDAPVGVTVMTLPKGEDKPGIGAVMITNTNGTEMVSSIKEGGKLRIIDIQRFKFQEGIELFIKNDLKRLLTEMEALDNTQRLSKDDMQDPKVILFRKNRKDFEEAVKSKDYAAFRRTFNKWQNDFDEKGSFEIDEIV